MQFNNPASTRKQNMTTLRLIKSIGRSPSRLALLIPLYIRFTPASSHSNPRLARKTILQTILVVAVSILAPIVAHADSATWNLNPTSGDWNTAANWTPMTVPNGPADIATFALSNNGSVSISADTEVNAITFTNPGTRITINPNLALTLSGTGVIGAAQFVTARDASDKMGNNRILE